MENNELEQNSFSTLSENTTERILEEQQKYMKNEKRYQIKKISDVFEESKESIKYAGKFSLTAGVFGLVTVALFSKAIAIPAVTTLLLTIFYANATRGVIKEIDIEAIKANFKQYLEERLGKQSGITNDNTPELESEEDKKIR